jgi:hypothetical protein
MTPNPLSINRVWRICNKIRTFLSLKNIDLKSKFDVLTCSQTNLVPFTEFIFIINDIHPELKLSQDESIDLVEYFQDECCKINYQDFIDVLRGENDEKHEDSRFVTTLEWEDPKHENVLTPFEDRHTNLILTKIAQVVKFKEIALEPYFQDYESMTNNGGAVTIAQFRRILNFVGITLGAKEFRLLTKRFMKFNYMINYCAFLETIRKVNEWIEKNGKVDDDDEEECPSSAVITCDFEQLPRPEFDDLAKMRGIEKPCHPCEHQKKCGCMEDFEKTMLRIKKHILDNGIRTREFFEKFDKLKRGFVTRNQFTRGLDCLGVSGLHRLTVGAGELKDIMDYYNDPSDPDRVSWHCFCDEIDNVFTVK